MSGTRPALWLLAGGNGAGKSTFYRTRLARHGVEFVNADLIERGFEPGSITTPSYVAAGLARERFHEYLGRELSFCYETVFSHESKLEMLVAAQRAGYHVNLVFIHLTHPALNEMRVRQRVQEGGHAVPSDKIASRIPRTLDLMRRAVALADTALLFDNSSREDPYRRVAEKEGDRRVAHVDPLPSWASDILFPPGG